MKAEYIDSMGNDLTVVNAARVSFDKHHDTFDPEGDTKLVRYLARHGHWTPFSHPQVTFRMTAPIFVARQAFKHKVGFTENEISRRYVDDVPEFFMPTEWRGKPVNAKQGSSDVVLTEYEKMVWSSSGNSGCPVSVPIDPDVKDFYRYAESLYSDLILSGVAPEQARMVLPQASYTSWYWTGSLASWARFYKLRTDSHAQSEIQELAGFIGPKMQELFPICWMELTRGAP